MSSVEVTDDLATLESLAPEWDSLAVLCEQPMATPAWLLGWWRHVAPADARPRVVMVRERGALIGLAPFYVRSEKLNRYRLMGDTFSASVAPLAAPDRTWDIAGLVCEALSDDAFRPDAVELAPVAAASQWPAAMRERWPGPVRPVRCCHRVEDAATATLHGTFDDWMMRRGSEFRRVVRRRMRALDAEDGVIRLSSSDRVVEDIASFVRLHEARWSSRGESRLLALGPRLPILLEEIAGQLLAEDRFRLWMVEVGDEPICADLSLVAGGEIVGVNTGWDERFKRLAPAQLVTVHKVKDAFERGERRLDMGWGSLGYKRAFADGTDPIAWTTLVPIGRNLPQALATAAPPALAFRARSSADRVLTEEQATKLRDLSVDLKRRVKRS